MLRGVSPHDAVLSTVQLMLTPWGSSAPAGPWIYPICLLGIEGPLGLFIILPGLSCGGQKSWSKSSSDGRRRWRWEARPGGALPALPAPLWSPSQSQIHSFTYSVTVSRGPWEKQRKTNFWRGQRSSATQLSDPHLQWEVSRDPQGGALESWDLSAEISLCKGPVLRVPRPVLRAEWGWGMRITGKSPKAIVGLILNFTAVKSRSFWV